MALSDRIVLRLFALKWWQIETQKLVYSEVWTEEWYTIKAVCLSYLFLDKNITSKLFLRNLKFGLTCFERYNFMLLNSNSNYLLNVTKWPTTYWASRIFKCRKLKFQSWSMIENLSVFRHLTRQSKSNSPNKQYLKSHLSGLVKHKWLIERFSSSIKR